MMIEEKYLTAMDLGSTKTALAVAKISGNDVQIVYYKEVPSEGILNSIVTSTRAAGPIQEVISDAENELKLKIRQVVVNLPKYGIRQVSGTGKMDRLDPDESITEEEIELLKTQALDAFPLEDPRQDAMYGAIAQSFSADDNIQFKESDILGVISDTLEGNFKLFIGKRRSIKTIENIFNKLGIAIANDYFTPVPQGNVILKEEEMNNGVALIDFGGGSSSVSVYKGGILRHFASIPFGGNEITGDISTFCDIPRSLAENIKKAYGMCMPEKLSILADKVLQVEGGSIVCKRINISTLSDIITCRMEEILDAMLYEIEKSGYADALRSGVVITGGGAYLGNLVPMIRERSGYNVRIGNVRPVFRMPDSVIDAKSPSASVALGMIMAAKNDGCANCLDEMGGAEYSRIVTREDAAAKIPATEQEHLADPEPLTGPEETLEQPAEEVQVKEEQVKEELVKEEPVKAEQIKAEKTKIWKVREESAKEEKPDDEDEDDDPNMSLLDRIMDRKRKKNTDSAKQRPERKIPIITWVNTTISSMHDNFLKANSNSEEK